MADAAVRIEGLARLRRDLRAMQPAALREVREVLKAGAATVAERARPNAPRRTGNLADSYRAGTAGNTAFLRSRLPQAGVHEYGGVIAPRGVPLRIKQSRPIGRGLDATQDRLVEQIAEGFEAVARRNGWS